MKEAVILAAGEGKRLRPFTVNKPKVMLQVAGRPILSYVIEALVRNGIRRIILVVGYRKEQLYDYFGSGEDFGAEITYVTQERQIGTAHALLQAKEAVGGEFLVLSGDNLITPDTLAGFTDAKAGTVLVKRAENPSRYGVVTLSDSNVVEIAEKPPEAKSNIVSTGIYTFDRKIFDHSSGELDIPDVLSLMLKEGYPLKAIETVGTWLDVIYPWDLLSLNDSILSHLVSSPGGVMEKGVTLKPPVVIGRNTVIRPNSYIEGPVVIGSNCEIGPFVSILPSTSIGDNVIIQPFSHIINSVISHNVSIGPGGILQDSVIDKGCEIKGRFTALSGMSEVRVDDEYHSVKVGAMIGEDSTIGASVTAQPGVLLGNLCQVGSLKLISGRIPDRSLII